MGEKNKDILFGRAVFGGFDRKAVMEYIDTLQRSTQTKLQEQEEASGRKIAAMNDRLEKVIAEKTALQSEVEALRVKVRDMEKLQEEIVELKAQLKVSEAEKEILREKSAKHKPTTLGEVDAMVQQKLN